MNQMTTAGALTSPSWKPDPAGISFEGRKTESPQETNGREINRGRLFKERAAPPVNPARRAASLAAAVALQGAVVALILAAGVKLPTKVEPLMVVNITTADIKPEDLPPPPPTLQQPQVTVTLPSMPDIAPDLPPPPLPVKTTAITVAPKGSEPAPPVYKAERYETVLLRSINSALRYPVIARQRHQQGTVYVRFVMDRKGRVLSSRIERSSRFPALDEEGLALLDRAQPLPAPPADVKGDEIALVVPIIFSLR